MVWLHAASLTQNQCNFPWHRDEKGVYYLLKLRLVANRIATLFSLDFFLCVCASRLFLLVTQLLLVISSRQLFLTKWRLLLNCYPVNWLVWAATTSAAYNEKEHKYQENTWNVSWVLSLFLCRALVRRVSEKIPSSTRLILMSERQLFILHSELYYFSFFLLEFGHLFVFVFICVCVFLFVFAFHHVWFTQRNYYILNFLIIYWFHKFTSQISSFDTTEIACISNSNQNDLSSMSWFVQFSIHIISFGWK